MTFRHMQVQIKAAKEALVRTKDHAKSAVASRKRRVRRIAELAEATTSTLRVVPADGLGPEQAPTAVTQADPEVCSASPPPPTVLRVPLGIPTVATMHDMSSCFLLRRPDEHVVSGTQSDDDLPALGFEAGLTTAQESLRRARVCTPPTLPSGA